MSDSSSKYYRIPWINNHDEFYKFINDIIENSTSPIVIKDRDCRNLLVNTRWEEVTGFSRDTAIGKTDDQFFPPESAARFLKNDRYVIESGMSLEDEEILHTPQGTRYLISNKFPLFDDHGQVKGLCGILTEITGRKLAEQELENNKEKFESLFNNAQVALFKTELDGKLIEVNELFAGMYGYSNIEDCLSNFKAGESWADKDRLNEMTGIIEKDEIVKDFETEIIRQDGRHIWVIFSVRLYRDEGVYEGSVLDITERKNIERELSRKESLQRKLVSNIGDVIVIIDESGINRYKSPNIEKLFGWKPEEVVGKPTWDNIHPEDVPDARNFFNSLMEDPDGSGTLECRYMCKDGTYKWIEFIGSNQMSDPDIQGILGNYQDITERKKAEQSLRESEERFKALHNASFGGITIHDKGTILDCNKGLSEITGYSVEELIGMDGMLLIAERSRDFVMSNILKGYEKPYEAYGVRKSGEEFPVRLEARNIPYKGEPVRIVEFRDITEVRHAEEERKKLQNQLMQSQKMESIGRLAGGVAHDFNNMLGVIIGYTELSLDEVENNSSVHNYLSEVLDAATRSMDITRQLLAFARQQAVVPSMLDLNETIGSMLKMLQRLIGEDITLNFQPGNNIWTVKIDPVQVDQILANLAVNSRDAITDVGKVTITTKNVTVDGFNYQDHPDVFYGDYVVLTFTDDGAGMGKDVLDNLFEPFYTTKAVNKGTGLGLATVYGIIKQNNGFINVVSNTGQGTSFKIYFPGIKNITGHEKKSHKKSLTPVSRESEVILLVEDEPGILAMASIMLKELGYTVLTAETPGEAVLVAKENPGKIDLLLTDVIMPEMNGKDLAGEMAILYPGIKSMFMSGYTADVIGHHGVIDDDVQFIQKPFSKQHLAVKVRELLDAKE